MGKLFTDWIPAATTMIGVVLLVVAILARVNPAEGCVLRPELHQSQAGKPIAMFLLAASAPGWGGAVLSAFLGAAFRTELSVWIELFLFQAAGYWVLGKLISIGWRRWRSREHQNTA
jgi:hypothetical protein